jgi:hypothetical protein
MKRYTKFKDRSRKYRKGKVFRLKKLIEREGTNNLFYSRHMVLDDGTHGSWVDIYFLSDKDKSIFWNACLTTKYSALHSAVSEKAFNIAYDLLSKEEIKEEFAWSFSPAQTTHGGKILTWQLNPRPKKNYPQFSGMTFDEFKKQKEKEIFKSGDVQVFEEAKVHKNYAYGCGLEAIIDAEDITLDHIVQFINKFKQLGEVQFKSDEPLSIDLNKVLNFVS